MHVPCCTRHGEDLLRRIDGTTTAQGRNSEYATRWATLMWSSTCTSGEMVTTRSLQGLRYPILDPIRLRPRLALANVLLCPSLEISELRAILHPTTAFKRASSAAKTALARTGWRVIHGSAIGSVATHTFNPAFSGSAACGPPSLFC